MEERASLCHGTAHEESTRKSTIQSGMTALDQQEFMAQARPARGEHVLDESIEISSPVPYLKNWPCNSLPIFPGIPRKRTTILQVCVQLSKRCNKLIGILLGFGFLQGNGYYSDGTMIQTSLEET